MKPRQFWRWMIETWEGKWQDSVHDKANFVNGKLIGTMYGVTPRAYAKFRGLAASSITVAMMKAITLDEAALIAHDAYYRDPGWDKLTWGPTTAFLCGWGWHSGPTLIKMKLQRILEVADDGILGPYTCDAYDEWLEGYDDVSDAQGELIDLRKLFFRKLVARRPSNKRFLNGWNNRVNSMAPGTPWWKEWDV